MPNREWATTSVAAFWGDGHGPIPTTDKKEPFELDVPQPRSEIFSQIVGTILIVTPIALVGWVLLH